MMAGSRIGDGFIDYHDGEGSAVVNGREYRWEFHEYCGPLFLRKDGEPLVNQPGEKHPVWAEFSKWYDLYKEKRKKAKSSEVVVVLKEEL
jgi:hypothetical protein